MWSRLILAVGICSATLRSRLLDNESAVSQLCDRSPIYAEHYKLRTCTCLRAPDLILADSRRVATTAMIPQVGKLQATLETRITPREIGEYEIIKGLWAIGR